MKEKNEELKKHTFFNSREHISTSEKKRILRNTDYLKTIALSYQTIATWKDFTINAMFAKILFPEQKKLDFDNNTYRTIDALSKELLVRNDFEEHLEIAVAQKILFPEKWSIRNKDFHSDEVIWQQFMNILKTLNPSKPKQWGNIYNFFNLAQNMKILAPERFQTLNLNKSLDNYIWEKHIKDELETVKDENYVDFASFAKSLKILNFPSKIKIETHEWEEMEREAQELKNEDILLFSEFSSDRKILAAKEINITNEHFDLIF